MQDEIWKDVDGYDGKYQVSNHGNMRMIIVYRCPRRPRPPATKPMKNNTHNLGYKRIGLRKNGKTKNWYIHQLVARAFIPNPLSKPEVNHIDCNKANNHISNLEWCTKKENMRHRKLMGLYDTQPKGSSHPGSKLIESDIPKMRALRTLGVPGEIIAAAFNISEGTLYSSIRGETWKHINPAE